MNLIRVLGIDPGTIKCGYGIIVKDGNHLQIEEMGFISSSSKDLQIQMIKMGEAFDEIFNNFDIDEVAMESIFFSYNPKSIIKLAQFRGALSMKILSYVERFGEYTPLQIKQALTGNGKSSKEQVAFIVSKIFGLQSTIKPLDVTDAIAVGLTHLQRRQKS